MKFEISTPEGYLLELTLQGPAAGVVRASSSAAGAAAAHVEGPGATPLSAGLAVPRLKRKYTRRSPREVPPAPQPAQAEEEASAEAVASPENDLPPQLVGLPQKHVDFYQRKLQENLEIYDQDKAKELAIDMLRRVAGFHIA